MSKVPLVLATLVSLNALAWSSSTPWKWDESGRAGIYAPDESEDVANTEAFGPRLCLVRTGGASGAVSLTVGIDVRNPSRAWSALLADVNFGG